MSVAIQVLYRFANRSRSPLRCAWAARRPVMGAIREGGNITHLNVANGDHAAFISHESG